jgi:hypothetical protein
MTPLCTEEQTSINKITLALPSSISPELLDPFRTHPTAHHIDVNVDQLMKHCRSCCEIKLTQHPLTYLVDFSALVFNMFPFYPSPGKNPQTEYYAPIIYSDDVLFHVTLQLSAQHMEKVQRRSDLHSRSLMTECIRLLRERIERSNETAVAVSDQTISAVAGLAAIEVSANHIVYTSYTDSA